MTPDQPALFDYGSPHRRPKLAAPRTGKPVYAKFRPVHRQLCDDCVRDIHARGQAVAPLPLTARWRRTHDGTTDFLCPRHKDERVKSDG